VGSPVAEGPAAGMPAIFSTAPGVLEEAGDPLLDATGSVIGLLYDDDSVAGSDIITFLPSQLVLGVADDLRSTDRVAPGWLGVGGNTATNATGAAVMTVSADSPAAGVLHAGEVIVGVNSAPVRTMAELRARLYVLTPNSTVILSVLDGTATKLVDITLGGGS
jgi:S1-C subfamily serine protease